MAGRSAGPESAGAQVSRAFSLLVVLGFLLFHVASTSGLYTWSLTQARFPK